jgi:RHS repeat-associated protein
MYRDAESGLLYAVHRYYDPGTGRFVTDDPLGRWFDAPHCGNGYAWVGSTYRNAWDPLGLRGVGTPGEMLSVFERAVSEIAPADRTTRIHALATTFDEVDFDEMEENDFLSEYGMHSKTAATTWHYIPGIGGYLALWFDVHVNMDRWKSASFAWQSWRLMHELVHVMLWLRQYERDSRCSGTHHPRDTKDPKTIDFEMTVFKMLLDLWDGSPTFRKQVPLDALRILAEQSHIDGGVVHDAISRRR